MKCEMSSCTKTARLKLSMDTGWRGRFCFKHSYGMLRGLINDVFKWNRGLYVQKVSDDDE